jgi:hypothetical protein
MAPRPFKSASLLVRRPVRREVRIIDNIGAAAGASRRQTLENRAKFDTLFQA